MSSKCVTCPYETKVVKKTKPPSKCISSPKRKSAAGSKTTKIVTVKVVTKTVSASGAKKTKVATGTKSGEKSNMLKQKPAVSKPKNAKSPKKTSKPTTKPKK